MQASAIFAENLNNVINTTGKHVKQLVASADGIDYTYFHRVRRGQSNPSLNKAEQIIRALKAHPQLSGVELWMFFIPNYFKESRSHNVPNIADLERLLQEADSIGILRSTQEQRAGIFRLAEILAKTPE